MADAWETLLAGSTIADGDAWEHIQAQGGGGELIEYHILVDGLEVAVEIMEIEVEIEQAEITSVIENVEILSEITISLLEAEI